MKQEQQSLSDFSERQFKGPKAPAPRDLGAEAKATLQAEIDAAPQIFAQRQKYDPMYADLDTQTMDRALFGDGKDNKGQLAVFEQAAPRYQAAINTANRSARQADVIDLAELGPEYVAAARNSDPANAKLMDELTRQAEAELKAGGMLTQAERASGIEDTRTAWGARGNLYGSGAVTAEVLDRAAQRRAKQDRSRQFGAGVSQLRFSQNPNLAGLISTQGMGSQLAAGGAKTGGSASQFDPFSSYAQDFYNTNYNAQMSAYNSSRNNRAGLIGAGIGALGGIIAAPLTGGLSLAATAPALAKVATT